jgi:small GTP-binding protein
MEPPLAIKVIVLGASDVGKTSVISWYCSGHCDSSILATVGAAFLNRTVRTESRLVNLMVWDTAGEERFRGVAPAFLRGAGGVVLVYGLTRPDSFEDLNIYMDLFLSACPFGKDSQLPVLLLGNKSDLQVRAVPEETVAEWKRRFHVPFHYVVSAKTGDRIEEAFQAFADVLAAPRVPEFALEAALAPNRDSCC